MEQGHKGGADGNTEEKTNRPSASGQTGGDTAQNGDPSTDSDSGTEDIGHMLGGLIEYLSISDEEEPSVLNGELNLSAVARFIGTEECANIIVMVGAGISTAAGIPDFRSPTGIYSFVTSNSLPTPECLFEIGYFKMDPKPFFRFAKEMFPQQLMPTLCHYFIRLLHEKGKLLRLYTQNIDTLEMIAGLPTEKVVEAHGTFYTSHCMNKNCNKEYDLPTMKRKIFSEEVPTCSECEDVIKPDVIFFGEALPSIFFTRLREDFPRCDLLIVMGTSLVVEPFASLIDMVPQRAPRLVINDRPLTSAPSLAQALGLRGFKFDSPSNIRDVFWLGTANDGCLSIAETLGWDAELRTLYAEEHTRLENNPI